MSDRAKREAARVLDLIDDGLQAIVDVRAALPGIGANLRFVTLPQKMLDDPRLATISSFITLRDRTIHVSVAQTPEEMRYAIAREIGRFVLHAERMAKPGYDAASKRLGVPRDSDQEEAEVFARHLLATQSKIDGYRHGEGRTSAVIARMLAIPACIAHARLNEAAR